jgi:hypothetical protein
MVLDWLNLCICIKMTNTMTGYKDYLIQKIDFSVEDANIYYCNLTTNLKPREGYNGNKKRHFPHSPRI